MGEGGADGKGGQRALLLPKHVNPLLTKRKDFPAPSGLGVAVGAGAALLKISILMGTGSTKVSQTQAWGPWAPGPAGDTPQKAPGWVLPGNWAKHPLGPLGNP